MDKSTVALSALMMITAGGKPDEIIAQRTQLLMASNPKLKYTDALTLVLRDDPILAKAYSMQF